MQKSTEKAFKCSIIRKVTTRNRPNKLITNQIIKPMEHLEGAMLAWAISPGPMRIQETLVQAEASSRNSPRNNICRNKSLRPTRQKVQRGLARTRRWVEPPNPRQERASLRASTPEEATSGAKEEAEHHNHHLKRTRLWKRLRGMDKMSCLARSWRAYRWIQSKSINVS